MNSPSNGTIAQLVFGTVVRNAPVKQGGELVLLDWSKKEVTRKVPIYPDNPNMDDDPNPRGNTRGCKGIAVIGNDIIAANFHTLQIFDRALNHKRDFSHGSMVGLHEIFSEDGESIWVSSTVIDAALEFDLRSYELRKALLPREMPEFQRSLELDPAGVDLSQDNRRRFLSGEHLNSHSHLHLNAVAVRNDRVYALFHRQGVVGELTSGEIVLQDRNLVRAHNVVFLSDSVIAVNDTYGQYVRIYDIEEGRQINAFDLSSFAWVRDVRRRAELANLPRKLLRRLRLSDEAISRPIFVRGLARADNHLFVGLSPASILCIDWRTGQLMDVYQYSKDPRVCVHGLAVVR